MYDPSSDSSFPAGFVISELANTRWTEDGRRIAVGIKPQEDELDEDEDDERANVDVWHWADDRLQSVQIVQADADRRFTYTSVYNVEDGRFARLADDSMRRVDIGNGRWASGRRDIA